MPSSWKPRVQLSGRCGSLVWLELDHDVSERFFPYGLDDVNHRRVELDGTGDLSLKDFRRAVGPLLQTCVIKNDYNPLAVAMKDRKIGKIMWRSSSGASQFAS